MFRGLLYLVLQAGQRRLQEGARAEDLATGRLPRGWPGGGEGYGDEVKLPTICLLEQ